MHLTFGAVQGNACAAVRCCRKKFKSGSAYTNWFPEPFED
jgi:hypothetical protein